jgi:hypothetical protein
VNWPSTPCPRAPRLSPSTPPPSKCSLAFAKTIPAPLGATNQYEYLPLSMLQLKALLPAKYDFAIRQRSLIAVMPCSELNVEAKIGNESIGLCAV